MKLTIIRGLPGSGKSTLAKTLPGLHLEADMYFIRNGKYEWNAAQVKGAHQWCFDAAQDAMFRGMDVVVSNTFVAKSQYAKYVELAMKAGYDVEIIACEGKFGSVHDVPASTLERMAAAWEP